MFTEVPEPTYFKPHHSNTHSHTFNIDKGQMTPDKTQQEGRHAMEKYHHAHANLLKERNIT